MPRFATGPLRRLTDTMTCPANLSLTMTPSKYRCASQSGAASHWKLYCFGQQTRNDSKLTPSNYRCASQSCAASPWKLYCLRVKSRNDRPTRRAYQSDGRWRVWSSARPKHHRRHHDIMWQVTLIINCMSRHSIRYNSFLFCCHLWCSLDEILLTLVILCPSDISDMFISISYLRGWCRVETWSQPGPSPIYMYTLSLSLVRYVALSALLWLWWFFAIFPDRSPVVMHQQCPAWSTLSNPGTRSLLVCPFSACLPSFLASVFSPYRSSGRCIHDNIILIIVHNIHASTTSLCSVRSFLSLFSPE